MTLRLSNYGKKSMSDIWIHAITGYPRGLTKKLDPTLSKAAGANVE